MSGFIEMLLIDGKTERRVWQKITDGKVATYVASQVVTYVDEFGVEIILPDTYEMTVVNGKLLPAPALEDR